MPTDYDNLIDLYLDRLRNIFGFIPLRPEGVSLTSSNAGIPLQALRGERVGNVLQNGRALHLGLHFPAEEIH